VLTETFIEAHACYLPGVALRLDCDPFPAQTGDGQPLISLGHPNIHRSLARLLFGLSAQRADKAIARRIPTRLRERVLARFLHRSRIAVILAEYGPTGVAVRRACAAANIPLVVHFHGYDAYHRETLDRHISDYRRMFDHVTSIVAVSRHMCDQLIGLGAPPEKIEFNPYGIDVELFSKGEPAAAPPVFLAVGRFVAKKAPDQTIKAFAKISARYPDARLEMIGDGPLHESCRDLARHLGISERVMFRGAIPHLEAARIMARGRCFVQHSVTPDNGDMEGTPLAVLEAMATRLPVVATRHGGIVDVVSDGETGYLVDELDVESMAKAMARLIESPATAARMGDAGRAFVLTKHSMKQQIGALASILQCAAASKSDN
jgi:glycosyltransferase involved in cell wall biosynthesis